MGIDFTEIQPSNENGITQDLWELFTEEFLILLGYEIVSPPSRGPDGGKDMVIKEIVSQTNEELLWLVSCKHNAYSGKSVTKPDESDIRDRLEKFNCNGFMGVYSTIANGSLMRHLEDSEKNGNLIFKVFHSAEIERHITGNPVFENIFQRYFPNSYKRWQENFPISEPIGLFMYYIKNTNNQLTITLLLEIFKTESNLIKCLRISNDVSSFLGFANLKWIKLNDFKDERISSKTSIWDIGKIMFEKINIEFSNRRAAGMGLTLYSIYILTDKNLVATNLWGNFFEDFYLEIKTLLN